VLLWSLHRASAVSAEQSDNPGPHVAAIRLTCTPRGSRRRSPGGSTHPRDDRRTPPPHQRPPACPGHVLLGWERWLGMANDRW